MRVLKENIVLKMIFVVLRKISFDIKKGREYCSVSKIL